MLRVDGHLSGRVSSADGTLIVSNNGQVDANIDVAVAQIFGTVNGDVIASKRIELGRVARVIGNIQTPALIIEQGAIFEGSCRMQQLRDEQNKPAAKADQTASAASTGTSSSTGAASASTSSSPSAVSGSSSSGPSSSAYGSSAAKDSGKGSSSGVTSSSDAVS
jgi:cytoskeletal protein CcmA (bactofilin family)